MSRALITGLIGKISVNITGYSTTIAAEIQSVQLQTALVHYTTKVSQNGLRINIQCSSESELLKIQKFISDHQRQNIVGNLNTLRLIYPYAKIDYTGFFVGIDGGGQRFDFAPQLSLNMLQVQGLIDSKSNLYSTAVKINTAQKTNPDSAETSALGG